MKRLATVSVLWLVIGGLFICMLAGFLCWHVVMVIGNAAIEAELEGK